MCMPTVSEINDLKNSRNCNMESSVEDYILDNIRLLEEDIEYYKRKMIEEEQRTASQNKFIKDFLDSLEDV